MRAIASFQSRCQPTSRSGFTRRGLESHWQNQTNALFCDTTLVQLLREGHSYVTRTNHCFWRLSGGDNPAALPLPSAVRLGLTEAIFSNPKEAAPLCNEWEA